MTRGALSVWHCLLTLGALSVWPLLRALSVGPCFEGQATPDLVAQWRRLLTVALEADGLVVEDPAAFRVATYGQMYTLKPRLNELSLRVKLK